MKLSPPFIPTHRFHDESLLVFPRADINAGLVSYRSVQHFDKFVRDAKEAGLWSKLLLVMPFIGSNLAMAMRGFNSTSGAIAASAVNFVEGDFSEATGLLGDGATKYLNTNYNSSTLPLASHLTAYVREQPIGASAQYALGAVNGAATQVAQLGSSNPTTGYRGTLHDANAINVAEAWTPGFYMLERISGALLTLYRNNVSKGTTAVASAAGLPNQNMFAFARNLNGTPGDYLSGGKISFLSIGLAMSAQERSDFYTIVHTLQMNLNRAV